MELPKCSCIEATDKFLSKVSLMIEIRNDSRKHKNRAPAAKTRLWSIPAGYFRWVTAAGFLLATCLLVSVIGMAYRETRQQIESSDAVIHSRDVLSAISDYAAATKSASNAATDYYATGNASDVPALAASEANIHSAIGRLQRLTADNPSQLRLAASLNSQMSQALVILHEVVDLRHQGKTGATGLVEANEAIKPISMDLNRSYEALIKAEDNLLNTRSSAQATASRRAIRLELWGGVFAFLLMMSVLAVFWRESSIRLRTEQQLAQTNIELEHRVRDRMADLENANGLLRIENTERVAAEDEIRVLNAVLEQRVRERTTQLEVANQEMEAFCYSVSHDLRAPLRHIDGFSKILLEDFGAQIAPEAAHCLNRIQLAILNMGHLVDDLLNLSRLTRTDLAARPVALGDVVNSVLIEMEPDLAGRKIDWRIGALPVVLGDSRLLKQVFVNLLANALKFTRGRDAAVIEVVHLPSAEETVIVIRDNGVGFNMKYAEKLFGVFQRLHSSAQFEGTGVGLATVQRIIQKHGGRVWAESQLEQGASFYFTVGVVATSVSGPPLAEIAIS
jgi:signal transduction histidine kinase